MNFKALWRYFDKSADENRRNLTFLFVLAIFERQLQPGLQRSLTEGFSICLWILFALQLFASCACALLNPKET